MPYHTRKSKKHQAEMTESTPGMESVRELIDDQISESQIETTEVTEVKMKKKKPPVQQEWCKTRDFDTSKEAEEYVESCRMWKKCLSYKTFDGVKVRYRCTHGQYRRKECPKGLYLLYRANDLKVSMFETTNEHDNHVRTSRGLTKEARCLVRELFEDGIRKPNAIIAAFRRQKLEEPEKSKLKSFLVLLRQEKLQPSSISVAGIPNKNRPPSPDEKDDTFMYEVAIEDTDHQELHIIQIPGKEQPSTSTAGESKKAVACYEDSSASLKSDDDNAESGPQHVDNVSSKVSQNGTMRLSAGSLFPETPAFSITQELMMDMHELSDKIQNFYPEALGKQFTLTFQGEDGNKNEYIFTSASETRRNGDNHSSLRCSECGFGIIGFRYKCVCCADYDLCSACENLGLHAEHLMMRIAKPIKLKRARTLLQQWCEAMQAAGITTAEEITRGLDEDPQPEPQHPPSSLKKSLVLSQIPPSITSSNKMARGNAINKGKTKAKTKFPSEEEFGNTKKRKSEAPEGDDIIGKKVGIKEEPIDDFYNTLNELEVFLPIEEMKSEDPDPLGSDKIKIEDTLTGPRSSSALLADPGSAVTTSKNPGPTVAISKGPGTAVATSKGPGTSVTTSIGPKPGVTTSKGPGPGVTTSKGPGSAVATSEDLAITFQTYTHNTTR